jgi:hypothetical protein
MPSPLAENDKFAIWRLGHEPASDIVLHKESGRWAIGSIAARRLDGRSLRSDEDRQDAIAEIARELDLEMTDGSPAVVPLGPSFGM